MARVTLSIPDELASHARAVAERSGETLSGLAAQGLRDAVARDSAARYRAAHAAMGDEDRAALAEFDAGTAARAGEDFPEW